MNFNNNFYNPEITNNLFNDRLYYNIKNCSYLLDSYINPINKSFFNVVRNDMPEYIIEKRKNNSAFCPNNAKARLINMEMKNKEYPKIYNVRTKKSKTIICPECKEACDVINNGYNIRTICNKGHESNYSLCEFDQTQYINEGMIKCDFCSFEGEEDIFFYCLSCEKNLCINCKSARDNDIKNKDHIITLYKNKKDFCLKHKEKFYFYCKNCKGNACIFCKKMHKGHNLEGYGKNKLIINDKNSKVEKVIGEIPKIFMNIENELYSSFNSIMQTCQLIYEKNKEYCQNITKDTFMNQKLFKIEDLNKDVENLVKISKENNIFKTFENFIKLSDNFLYTNSITSIYDINEQIKINGKVKILGKEFIENNKDNCRIIYNNKKLKLSHTLNINEEELEKLKDNKLFIQICFNKEITDLSHLFEDSDFYACPDIHKINTRYISNMSHMFNNCTSLVVKPDLSQINLENIIHVDMFSNCTNLDKFKNPQKLKMLEIKSVKNLYSDNLDSSPKKIKMKYESKSYLFDNIENEIDRDSQYSEGRYPNKDLVESLDCYGCDNKSDSILSSNNYENRTKNPSPIGSNSSITYKSPSETSYNFKDECKYLYEISLRKNYHAYKILFKENSNYSDNSKRRNNTDGLKNKIDFSFLKYFNIEFILNKISSIWEKIKNAFFYYKHVFFDHIIIKIANFYKSRNKYNLTKNISLNTSIQNIEKNVEIPAKISNKNNNFIQKNESKTLKTFNSNKKISTLSERKNFETTLHRVINFNKSKCNYNFNNIMSFVINSNMNNHLFNGSLIKLYLHFPSSPYEDDIVYIKFIKDKNMFLIEEKGKTSFTMKYPFGYLLPNIQYNNKYIMNLFPFK